MILGACLFFCLFPQTCAAQEVVIDAERQFQFAEDYFQSGEYYRAIGEYERFIFFFPLSEKVELARYRIGLSYLRGERYRQAIATFNAIIEEYRSTRYALRSYLEISRAYVGLKGYDVAIISLNNLIAITRDQEIRDEAYYQRGWVYLEMGLWNRARESFEHVSEKNRQPYHIEKIISELESRLPLKTKDPTLAGMLAVVPGAGHLYTERKKDALVSFLVNGALIWAACEAFDNDLDVLGGIITFVELGFYSGNIYSAVSSAHKYNRNEKSKLLNYLKKNSKIGISLGRPNEDTALVLSFKCSF